MQIKILSLTVLLSFITVLSLHSQTEINDSLIIVPESKLKVSKAAQTNPPLLVKELTANVSGETEKFNVLFSWVVHNISYDYRAYFAPGGTYSNIPAILSRKSAICVGYAMLMDSLCKLANIENISVYGYAKDEHFDVHDSLYIDNHAWNAVKLDGLWYVYDVTWSTGAPVYKLDKFNKWKEQLLSKAKRKYKKKKVRKRARFLYTDDCGNIFSNPAYYYKERFFNKIYLKLLSRFKLYYKLSYSKAINNYFYLSQPEVFAITHFPDDPVWSLTSWTNIKRFENDSAFYFMHDSIYKLQVREGRECAECDVYFESDNYKRNLILKQKSFSGNRKNSFIQSMCNYELAEMNLAKLNIETDSLLRVQALDSAIYYFTQSQNQLKTSKAGIIKEFKQLTLKNKVKLNAVVAENKANKKFVTDKVKITLEQGRNLRKMSSRSPALSTTYRKKAIGLTGIIPVEPKVSINNAAKIKAAEKKIVDKETIVDSLSKEIEQTKTLFAADIDMLSLNVWQQVLHHDSIKRPFKKCIFLRKQLKDNYKKVVKDTRLELSALEKIYTINLNSVVYRPSKITYESFKRLIKLFDTKYALERDILKLKRDLIKQGSITVDEFKDYRKTIMTGRQNDYCWIENMIPVIKVSSLGLEALRLEQEKIYSLINTENHTDRMRFYMLSKEYLRRDKKHKNIVTNNTVLVKKRLKDCAILKRSFQKKDK